METVRLLPLAHSEILGKSPNFFEKIFAGKPPAIGEVVVGDDLIELSLAGG
jgi:hypothetical protein